MKNFDAGKAGIELPENERAITGQRTHTSNLQSIVKALVALLLDVMRTTEKENAIGNARQSGNMGGVTLKMLYGILMMSQEHY